MNSNTNSRSVIDKATDPISTLQFFYYKAQSWIDREPSASTDTEFKFMAMAPQTPKGLDNHATAPVKETQGAWCHSRNQKQGMYSFIWCSWFRAN